MPARIVYVEDNYPSMLLITRQLERAGYSVEGTDTGSKGLTLIQNSRPDVILLDINLPDITGDEIARRLREQPAFKNTPMIAITAGFYDMGGRGDSPFDICINKPVLHGELMDAIETALSQR